METPSSPSQRPRRHLQASTSVPSAAFMTQSPPLSLERKPVRRKPLPDNALVSPALSPGSDGSRFYSLQQSHRSLPANSPLHSPLHSPCALQKPFSPPASPRAVLEGYSFGRYEHILASMPPKQTLPLSFR